MSAKGRTLRNFIDHYSASIFSFPGCTLGGLGLMKPMSGKEGRVVELNVWTKMSSFLDKVKLKTGFSTDDEDDSQSPPKGRQ